MNVRNKWTKVVSVLLCLSMIGQSVFVNSDATVYASNEQEASVEVVTDATSKQENSKGESLSSETISEEIGDETSAETASDKVSEEATTEVATKAATIILVCKDYSSSAVQLEWSTEDVGEYSVFSVCRDGKEIDTVEVTEKSTYSYSDANVSANASYTYQVYAVDEDGETCAYSDEVLVEVVDNWTVSGNTTLTGNKTVKNLTVTGGTLNLSSYELKVTGSVTFSGGTINVNKGYLECNNFSMSGYSYIQMNDPNSYILVKGNFTYGSYSTSSLTAGTLEIKGNYTYNSYYNDRFVCSGTHTTILSGDTKQTIVLNGALSYFNILELKNKSKEGIYSNGPIHAIDLRRNGCNLDINVEGGKYGWTLEEDEIIEGDLILISDTLDLNGHSLTVTGDLIHVGGCINVNKGTLEVTGDYYIENKKNTDGTDTFAKSTGVLKMVNAEDYVKVGGKFDMGSIFSHSGRLTNGTLEVKGDVKQVTYGNQSNFATTGNHKLLLSGEEAQSINFAHTSSSVSRVANLEITNEKGVTIGSNKLTVTGTVTDNGNKVGGELIYCSTTKFANNTYNGNVYMPYDVTINDPLVIGGFLSVNSYVYLKNSITVKGSYYTWYRTTYFYGNTVTVGENVTVYNSTLNLGGGKLYCEGNMHLQPQNSYLYMNNANDYVYVGGNFIAENWYSTTLTAGTIEIKGDFTQKVTSSANNFAASGSHKVILSGDKKQTVTFASTSSTFNILELQNTSNDGVVFNSPIINANQLIKNNTKVRVNGIGVLGWTLTEDTILEGDVYLVSDQLDLNGHKLSVSGNLYVGAGSIYVNGGSLEVEGDLRYQTVAFKEDGTVSSYGNSRGYLIMTNAEDKVLVNGNFIMQSQMTHGGKLTAGTLEIKGNFTQSSASYYNFQATKEHKTVLSGTEAQSVTFAYPSTSYSYFNILEVTNTSSKGVTLNSGIYVNSKLSDVNRKIGKSNYTYIPNISCLEGDNYGGSIYITGASKMTRDMTIAGTVTVKNNFDLSGFNLTTGYYYIDGGTTKINGGNLSVIGNLTVNNYGYFNMTNPEDYVCVTGSFTTNSYYSHNGLLTNGTLEIRGDFTQNTNHANNFLATGEHTTVLSGKAGTANRNYVQVIKFNSPGSSKFNHLVLNKALSLYSFTPAVAQLSNDYTNEAKDDEAPEVVQNIVVTNRESTKITLSWDAATDNECVTGYEVYRGNVKVGTTSKTSFVDSGLAPNTTYVYKVCAFDEMRNVSSESEQISATTLEDTQAPTVPSAVKVKTKTGSAITITWNASSDDVAVKGYIVYRDDEEVANLQNITLYRDTDVKQDELYTYQIKAYDAAGNESDFSVGVKGSIAMPEITSYSPVHNTSIGGGSTTITVYYKNVGNSTGNKVKFEYQAENDAGEKIWEQIGGVLYGQQTYNSSLFYSRCTWDYSNVTNGECKMRITLYDADGNTDEETFSYIIDTEGPKPTDELKAQAVNGVVTLSWAESDSADCIKYKVYKSDKADGVYTLLGTVADNKYQDKNVETGKTYYYKVSGLDGFSQEGALSDSVEVKVDVDEEPPKVTGISVKDQRINKVATVKVTAEDNLQVASISLEYKDKEKDKWVGIDGTDKVAANGVSTFSFDTTALEDGTYTLRAIATDAAGNKSAGTFVYEEVEITLDPFYADVEIDNTGIEKIVVTEATGYSTYVTLKWNNVPEDDFSYFVVEQLDGEEFKRVATIYTTLGAHIQNLSSDTEYCFRVVGYDNLGNRGVESKEIRVTTTTDEQAPIVKTFYPANKYFNSTIPLSLTVTDNVGVTSLKLQYSLDRENWNDMETLTPSSVSKSYTFSYNFDVSEITEGTVYVRAYAYDAMGNESNSNGEPIENNFVVDRTAPQKVANVVAEGMSGYNSITWDKAAAEDLVKEFRVYRAEEEVGTYTLLASGITTNIYYDTKVTPGTVYTYKVLAVDQAGNVGEYSSEVVAQSREDDEAPIVHAVTPLNNSKITGTATIQAIVTDNVSVNNVTFEYKPKDSEEDIWTELGNVTINQSSGYPSVQWDVSKYDNKEYEVRISAVDYNNNISNTYTVTYVVDTEAPKAPVVEGKAIGFGAILSWKANTEKDFEYYEIYRKLGSDEEYSFVIQTTDSTYQDNELKGNRKYQYKVYAYDDAGNVSVSEVCEVTPTTEDKQKPVAVTSENLSARVGSEVLLDATASHDNVKIESYKWDMGNGDIVYGAIARYTYDEMGTYQAKLTVTDTAGNTDTTEITIRIRSRISAKVNFKVVNQDNGNNFAMSYAYVYIENDGIGVNYKADCYGELSVVLSAGTYTVDVYKEGFMPKSYSITVSNGDEKTELLTIEKGELVTGKLTTTRLTLQEILDLGVDIQDPNNWYTYTYTMTYTQPGTPIKQTQNVVLVLGQVKKVTYSGGSGGSSSGGGGGGSYYVGLTEVEGKKVVTVYRTVSFLKKMYDVELQVTNNAEDGYGFDIINSSATLNLPAGLSLLKISTPQSLTNDIGTLYAQETKETHWYIKADEPGSYNLSASFNGTLMPFEAPVNTVISADSPLEVTPEEDNTFTDEGFVTNPTDYVIRVIDKQGNRVKGAIVTLSAGGKQCQTITNSRGTALLEVNQGDGRTFTLNIQHDDFIMYSQSYSIKTPSYTDTIKLYRPGESQDDDYEEGNTSNPYIEGYDIAMYSAVYDGVSIINKVCDLNRVQDKQHSLNFSFSEAINKYELSLGGEVIATGEAGTDTLCITLNGKELEKNGRFSLTVYGEEKSATYSLKLWAEVKVYDTVMMKYESAVADLLTESYNIYTADKDVEFTINCNPLSEVGDVVSRYALVQGEDEISTSTDGNFALKVDNFKPYEIVYLIAYDEEDEIIVKDKLYLNVIKTAELPPDFTLALGSEEFSIEISDDTPILGGCKMSVGFDDLDLPYDLEYTNEGCKIIVGSSVLEGEGESERYKYKKDKNTNKLKTISIIKEKLEMGVDVTGSLYGNYDSTKFEGTLELKFTISGQITNQLAVGPVPVVVEVKATGELSATGTLTLDFTEEAKETISGALELALKIGLDAYAGIGVAEVASVGIYGTAELGIGMDVLPTKTAGFNKVAVDGDLGLRAKVLWFEYNLSVLSGTYTIYEKPENNINTSNVKAYSVPEINAKINTMSNYALPAQEDIPKKTEWMGTEIGDNSGTIETLQGNVIDGTTMQLVAADDVTLLFYQDVDNAYSIANGGRLAYSIYENGKFTNPAYVDASEGHAQYGYDVYENNGDIYVVWQESKTELEDTTTLLEATKSLELKVAKFNSETATFDTLGTITDNDVYESNPQICVVDGNIYVTWSENSKDDVFAINGTNAIYKAVYSNNEWASEKIADNINSISIADAGQLSEGACLAYVQNGSGRIINLSNNREVQIAKNADNMQFGYVAGNRALIWKDNGTLCYAGDMESEAKVLLEESDVVSDSYKYVSDSSGNSSIVYTMASEGKSQIYVSDYDQNASQWGEPQPITDQDYYIENVDGAYVNNQLILSFHRTEATLSDDSVDTKTDLCCMKVDKQEKISVEDVFYNAKDVIPGGEVLLEIGVMNKGLNTVKAEDMTITITDANGKVKATVVGEKSIQAGTGELQNIKITLPYTLAASTYTVTVSCGDISASKEITLGYADLKVDSKLLVDHDTYELQAIVENLGIEAAGGKVVFYNKNDESEILDEQSFDALNYGEKCYISYKISDDVYDGTKSYTVGIRVETDMEQINTNNDQTGMYLAPRNGGIPCRVIFDYVLDSYVNVYKYVSEGNHVEFPKAPVREGYEFIGWYAGDIEYTAKTAITDDVVLVAKYKKVDKTTTEQPTTTPSDTTKGDTTKNPTVSSKNNKRPAINTKFTYKGITYKVTGKGTVSVYKIKNKKLKNVTIPTSVKIKGYTFKVTSIGENAFKYAKKLKKVVIGKNITKIGKGAFTGCKALKTIQFKTSKLKTVGKKAFMNIHRKAKLIVPYKKYKKYKKLLSKKGQSKTVTIKKK